MANFEESIALVLKHEGGFVDDPDDSGGMTNFGITEGTYEYFFKVKPNHDMMLDLTIEQAKSIYKKLYWDAFNLDNEQNQKLATIALNMSVLRGVNAIKPIFSSGPLEIILNSQKRFVTIVRTNPTQIRFLLGWINRTHELLRYLYER